MSAEKSHPVEIECPSCSHHFQFPLKALSVGVNLPCPGCGGYIMLATPAFRQLLQEIEKDLHTPDDLPLLLRPTKLSPAKRATIQHRTNRSR